MLGFKGAIVRDIDKAWGALSDLRSAMDKIIGMEIEDISTRRVIADRIKAYIFSDSILVFTLSDQPEDIKAILILASELFSKSLTSCVPLRGGISFGKFYFNEELNLFCGEPFVQAYQIGECAQWSGIVVHDSVAENYFNMPSMLKSGENSILIQWDVPLKPSGQKKHWVINWPHIYKQSFKKPPPIATMDFYQAFESLFGSYDELRKDVKVKYVNTVEFINFALNQQADNPGNFELMIDSVKGDLWSILPSILFFVVAFICFCKHLPIWIILCASFTTWLVAAFVHQWLLNK